MTDKETVTCSSSHFLLYDIYIVARFGRLIHSFIYLFIYFPCRCFKMGQYSSSILSPFASSPNVSSPGFSMYDLDIHPMTAVPSQLTQMLFETLNLRTAIPLSFSPVYG